MGLWDEVKPLLGGQPASSSTSAFEMPSLDIASIYGGGSSLPSQEESPYYYGERGFVGDTFSNLARGFVSGIGISGYALDQAGLETGMEEWAQSATQRYTFLKPDVSEQYDQDSWLYKGYKGALQSAPASLTPIVAGTAAGALAGGGVPGAAVGFATGAATLVGLFGMGTYNQTYREAIAQGVDPAKAKQAAFTTAASEVGTEALSDVVAVATGGVLGLPMKAMSKGATTTLKSMLKMGPVDFAKRIGATVSAEVGTEALNAYVQTSTQLKAGMEMNGLTPAAAALASIGPSLWLSGGLSIGLQGLGAAKQREFVKVLSNEKVDPDIRRQYASVVGKGLGKEGQDIADKWLFVANYAIDNALPLNISQNFIEQYNHLKKAEQSKEGGTKDIVQQSRENAGTIVDAALNTPGTAPIEDAEAPTDNPLLDAFREAYSAQGITFPADMQTAQLGQQIMTAPEGALPQDKGIVELEKDAQMRAGLSLYSPTPPAPTALTGPSEPTQAELLRQRDIARRQEAMAQFDAEQENAPLPDAPVTSTTAESLRKGAEAREQMLRRTLPGLRPEPATVDDIGPVPSDYELYEPTPPPTNLTPKQLRAAAKARTAAEVAKGQTEQQKIQDTKAKRDALMLEPEMEASLLPDVRRAIAETPLAEIQKQGFTAVENTLARIEAETAAPTGAIVPVQEQQQQQQVPVTKSKQLRGQDRMALSSAIRDYESIAETESTQYTEDDAGNVSYVPASTRRNPQVQRELAETKAEVQKLVGKIAREDGTLDPEVLRTYPELRDIVPEMFGPEVDKSPQNPFPEANPTQQYVSFVEQKVAAAETDEQKDIVAMSNHLATGDRKAAQAVLNKYDGLSRQHVITEAISTLREYQATINRERDKELPGKRKATAAEGKRQAFITDNIRWMKSAQYEAQKLGGMLLRRNPAAKEEISEGLLNWKKGGPNLWSAEHPDTGETYFLFRQSAAGAQASGRWRIVKTDTVNIKSKTDPTKTFQFKDETIVFGSSKKGEKLDQYVRRFYREAGVAGVTSVAKSNLADVSPAAYSYGNKDTTFYFSRDGKYVAVPKKGGFGILSAENFRNYQKLSKAQKTAAFKNEVAKATMPKEEAFKALRILGKVETKVQEGPKEQKKTFRSGTLQAYQKESTRAMVTSPGRITLGKTSTPVGTEEARLAQQAIDNPPSEGILLKLSKVPAAVKRMYIYRNWLKGITDYHRFVDDLLHFRDKIDQAFTSGKISEISPLRQQIMELFRLTKLSRKGKRVLNTAVDEFMKATVAGRYQEIQQDIADLQQSKARSASEQIKTLEQTSQRYVEYAAKLFGVGKIQEDTGKLSQESTDAVVALLNDHHFGLSLDILQPPALPKIKGMPESLSSKEDWAKADKIMRRTVKSDVWNQMAAAHLETEARMKELLPNLQTKEESAADKQTPHETPIQRPAAENTAQQQTPKPPVEKVIGRKVAKSHGVLVRYDGEKFWSAPSGHTLQKIGSRWVTFDPTGRELALAYPSIAKAAMNPDFAKQPAAQVRTPENLEGTLTGKAAADLAAYKAAEAKKKAADKPKTLREVEEEALVAEPINGWQAPVREKGIVTLKSKSGNIVARLTETVVSFGLLEQRSSFHWLVQDVRDSSPIGKFASVHDLMTTISGNVGPAKARQQFQARAKFAMSQTELPPTGNTALRVAERLRKALGESAAKRWDGMVNIIQSVTPESAVGREITNRGKGGETVGYYNPVTNVITLVADFIAPGAELDIFLHEGLHFVFENDAFFKKHKAQLLGEMLKLRNSSDAMKRAFGKASTANPDLAPDSLELAEEAYAYFMQDFNNRETSFWRKAVSFLKRMLMYFNVPVGKLGLTDADFSAMASRSLNTVVPTKAVEDVYKAYHIEGAVSHEVMKARAMDPEFARKFARSVLKVDGVPLVLFRDIADINSDSEEVYELSDTELKEQDALSLYGYRSSPEGLTTARNANTKSGGSLVGYHVVLSNPAIRTKAQLTNGIFGPAEVNARVKALVDFGYHDGIIVTEKLPQYDSMGKIVEGTLGRITDVVVFKSSQMHEADIRHTAADVASLKFAAALPEDMDTELNQRRTSDAELDADLALQDPLGTQRWRPAVTEATPKDKKGNPRPDYLSYDSKGKRYLHYSDFSAEENKYQTIRQITRDDAVALREEFADSREQAQVAAAHLVTKNAAEQAKEKASLTASKGVKLAKDLLQTLSDRVREISRPVYAKLMRMEHDLHQRERYYHKAANDFYEAYKELPEQDKFNLDQALRNGDLDVRDRILQRNGITSEFQKVDKLLNEILQEASEYGLIDKTIKNYFPRVVVGDKLDQLRLALEARAKSRAERGGKEWDNPEFTVIGNELRMAEEAARKKGRPFTDADRQAVISRVLNTGHFQFIPKPGSSKLRTYSKVSPEHAQYYENSAEALKHHIYEMANAIEIRKFLGKSNITRPQIMGRLLRKIKSIEKFQEMSVKAPLLPAQQKAFEKLLNESAELQEKLGDVNNDLEDSVSNYIVSEIASGNIKDDPLTGKNKSEELVHLLRSRLTQRGTHGFVGTLRDVGYMFALGSPLSAITQIGDIAWSAYANGIGNTAAAIFKSLPAIFRADGALTKDYFDFSHAMKDFSTNASAAMLDKVLTASGLKSMDLFGKEVFMQAALRRSRNMKKEAFADRWAPMFDGNRSRALKVKERIDAGDFGDQDVLFTLFNDLGQWQPISLSEMPAAYNQAGNMRIFYMLKSFNIKALNNLRRELINEGQGGSKIKAAAKFVYLATLLGLAGAGSDEIKDWILGRERDFSDHFHDNLIQLTLMNRYALERGFNQGRIVSAFMEGMMPPFRYADYALDDLGKFFFDRENFKAKSIQNIPGVGRIIYSRTDVGQKSELDRRKESLYSAIKRNASDGLSLFGGDVRQLLGKYNTLATELGEAKLKYDTLKNVRKKELKRLREAEAS